MAPPRATTGATGEKALTIEDLTNRLFVVEKKIGVMEKIINGTYVIWIQTEVTFLTFFSGF